MEPATAIGGALVLFGAKDVVVKLLGPTADYLGGGLKDYTKKGCENIARVFDVAIRKLGPSVTGHFKTSHSGSIQNPPL